MVRTFPILGSCSRPTTKQREDADIGEEKKLDRLRNGRLKQCAKLFRGQTGVTNDTAHGKRIHRIVAWDSKNPAAVGHDDMFSLPHDSKAGFF